MTLYQQSSAIKAIGKRLDLDAIVDIVTPGARVLDLGCGDGSLLVQLVERKQVVARGIEISEANVRACIGHGLSVRHGNIEEGLADYPDRAFDYVILSLTLAFLDRPEPVVREMLRVGDRAVISFENAGYWRERWYALLGGGAGYELCSGEPRMRAITLKQFSQFCVCVGATVKRSIFTTKQSIVTHLPSLLAEIAVYVLAKDRQ